MTATDNEEQKDKERAWAIRADTLLSEAADLGLTCTLKAILPTLYRMEIRTSPKLVAEVKKRRAKEAAAKEPSP